MTNIDVDQFVTLHDFWKDHGVNHLPFLDFLIDSKSDLHISVNDKDDLSLFDDEIQGALLEFMRLPENQVEVSLQKSIDILKVIKEKTGFNSNEVKEFILDPDWRLNIVAVVFCLLFDTYANDIIEAIWHCLDNRCWVSPQISTILSLIDKNFIVNAIYRIERKCKVNNNLSNIMESHSKKGPGSDEDESEKFFGALLFLLEEDGSSKEMVASLIKKESIRNLLLKDDDNGYYIAQVYKKNLLKNMYLLRDSSPYNGG